MKKLLGIIFLFICITSVSANEINFLDNPDWNTVLEKARKENKMIFLDAYAVWCGPCKMMDSMTYKDKAVADYYNANFINVKYDMEKGQGPALAQNYGVTAFPNLIFINTDGALVHRGVGYQEGKEFLTLGRYAKDVMVKFAIDKKNALNLTPKEFLAFANQASSSRDEDLDQLFSDFMLKQGDILGSEDLIALVMAPYAIMPDEKSLAYVVNNKAKIIATGNYDALAVDDRIVGLALSYSLSPEVQQDETGIDYNAMKVIFDKYIPERAFFVLNYFKVQYMSDNNRADEVLPVLNLLLANSPDKVTFSQACNAMIVAGPLLSQAGKLEEPLKKFESLKLTANEEKNVYMKDFVKAIIYIKNKDVYKFKVVANAMIGSDKTPESVKADLKETLTRMK